MIEKKRYLLYIDVEEFMIVKDYLFHRISIRACATKYNVSPTS
jgi:hypothetical protein